MDNNYRGMKSILFAILIFASVCVGANTFYIAPAGNDNTGNGTMASPWFTLEKAWDYVAAGDTIYVRGGTYLYAKTQTLTGISGTSGNMINIYNYPGETPIMTQAAGWVYEGWYYGVFLQSSDYIHIRGLELSGFKYRQTSPCRAMMAQHCNNCIFELLSCQVLG